MSWLLWKRWEPVAICLAPTRDQPEVIDSYLAEECSRDRVLGPLTQDPSSGTSKQIQSDPKGNVRKVATNSGHVPKDRSVNDGIMCSLTYVGAGWGLT